MIRKSREASEKTKMMTMMTMMTMMIKFMKAKTHKATMAQVLIRLIMRSLRKPHCLEKAYPKFLRMILKIF